MSSFVLDGSVTMAWCFEDETTAYSERVLDLLVEGGARVPRLWAFEVQNVLALGERRGRLTPAHGLRFLELLRGLPIAFEDDGTLDRAEAVLSLARAHGLSAYDAAYLELAAREGLPLATEDRALREAMKKEGIADAGNS